MEVLRKRVLKSDIFQVLTIKPFFLMMLSEFFSQVAFNMQHFVLIFIIYGFTRSNTAVSGMILSFMIPAVLFSVISGVYVDRWNKKKVLLFIHLIRAVLLLPFLIPNLHLGLIYALTFLIAVVTQFFIPAEYSIIPQLVPKKLLVSANAVFSFGIFTIMLIGYILSGPALLFAGIKLTDRKKEIILKNTFSPQRNYSFTKEANEVFVFIKKAKKVMHAFFMITIAQAVIFMFAVLAPGYVTTILEAPLESVSVILIAPAGLGFGIGAFMLGSMGRKIKQRISAIGFMVVGIVFILMPLASRVTSYRFVLSLNSFLAQIIHINILHIIVLMAFITGFGISLVSIPSNSIIQIETSQEMRGRMYGLLSALTGAVSFLPVILAGWLADIFGVGTIIASVGIIVAILSACYLFLIKL